MKKGKALTAKIFTKGRNQANSQITVVKIFILCFFFCLSLAAGCGKDNKPLSPDCSSYEPCDFSSVSSEDSFQAFAVRPAGGLLAAAADGTLISYSLEGTEQQRNASEALYKNLCFDGEACYAFDFQQSAVVELTGEGKTARTITNAIPFHTVRSMVALDGKIYVLGVLLTEENRDKILFFGTLDFENYGEIVYCINVKDGSYTTLPLKNIVAEYRSEDGGLYFYGWEENEYILYQYDPENGKTVKEYRQKAMRNSLAIVVEGGYLFAMTPDSGLIAIDLETGEEMAADKEIYATISNSLQFYHGNLFAYDIRENAIICAMFITKERELNILNRDEKDNNMLIGDKAPSVGPELIKRDEQITICSSESYKNLLDENEIKRLTGMKTRFLEMPIDYEAAVAELMAGNSEVDIYLLGGDIVSRRCRDIGFYVDLRASQIITDYLDGCLDEVQKVSRLENGDIWMLPIDTSMTVTWYVPENMQRFGLTVDNLDTVPEYLGTMKMLEDLQETRGDYQYYCSALTFMILADAAYSNEFNDFENGKVNFLTDTYRELAKTLWTGWDLNGPPEHHSPFYSSVEDYEATSVGTKGETKDLDKEKVIFKTEVASEHLLYQFISNGIINEKLEGWRVMGTPGLNAPRENTGMGLTFAVVNPYSKQKEAAISYLEGIIAGGAKTRRSAMSVFLKKNLEDYAEIYDITLPAVRDFHELFARVKCGLGAVWAPYMDHIAEYQQGLITLEQAIIKQQKQYEGGLYE